MSFFFDIPNQIAKKMPSESFDENNVQKVEKSVYLYETNEVEILKAISSLKNKKSFGYDGLSNMIVKAVKNQIVQPLVHIINLMMNQGIFPSQMKKNNCKTTI